MKKTDNGVWLIADTVVQELGTEQEAGYSVQRAAIHLGGQPHLRAANRAIAELVRRDQSEVLEAASWRNEPATVLAISEVGSVRAFEGRIVRNNDRPMLLKKGGSRKGWDLSRMDVLDVRLGYSQQSSLEHTWKLQASRLGPVGVGYNFDGIPEYEPDFPEEQESPLIKAVWVFDHPGFTRGDGGTPGCLFLATDVQTGDPGDEGIVNGYLWAPATSDLTSEHGSQYFKDLDRRGARLLDFKPGNLTFRQCVMDELPGDRKGAYEMVLGHAQAFEVST